MNIETASVREMADVFKATIPAHVILSAKDSVKTQDRWFHTNVFLDFERLIIHPEVVDVLSKRMANEILRWNVRVRAIIAPERGATTLSCMLALYLQKHWDTEVLTILAEKNGKGGYRIHPRNVQLLDGIDVATIDDVGTSGTALRKVNALAGMDGARVLGSYVCWDRSSRLTARSVNAGRFGALCRDTIKTWTSAECAIDGPCEKKEKISTAYGHGAEYLEELRQVAHTRR